MKLDINDQNSSYIGDGAYAHKDPYGRLWVITTNGLGITNQICLEDEVFYELYHFYNDRILKDRVKDENTEV